MGHMRRGAFSPRESVYASKAPASPNPYISGSRIHLLNLRGHPRETLWAFWTLQPDIYRSAPKGRQQVGETGFCINLRFSAVSCENLRFPAVFCANLRLPNPSICRASRKSAKICKKSAKMCVPGPVFSLLLSPFWRALNL